MTISARARGAAVRSDALAVVRARRGFTLVELIVVIVVMAVVAGLVLPRVAGATARAADAEAGRVESVVEAGLRRAATSAAPVRLVYEPASSRADDGDGGELRVERWDASAVDSRRSAWRVDALSPTVRLGVLELDEAQLGAERLPRSGWTVALGGSTGTSSAGAGEGDSLLIRLAAPRVANGVWLVAADLSRGAVAVQRESASARVGDAEDVVEGALGQNRRVDLDAQGREDEPW